MSMIDHIDSSNAWLSWRIIATPSEQWIPVIGKGLEYERLYQFQLIRKINGRFYDVIYTSIARLGWKPGFFTGDREYKRSADREYTGRKCIELDLVDSHGRQILSYFIEKVLKFFQIDLSPEEISILQSEGGAATAAGAGGVIESRLRAR
ncbi:MAG: hypothetical protein A3E87_04185 [Gammaproteobacteria bacterium RIFCSPHIGHO2_12_FULL_35_23]|nr:MAG: hypothetical protein A3E87_04185 [Gammaproteobacteria bacterium RIFCSPHIGHO2_12_FULL_35_23]